MEVIEEKIMPFSDLREYIEALEKEGELVRIEKQVDWNLELGAVIRRCYDLKAPAPLFENIKDHETTYCKKRDLSGW